MANRKKHSPPRAPSGNAPDPRGDMSGSMGSPFGQMPDEGMPTSAPYGGPPRGLQQMVNARSALKKGRK